MSSRKAVPKKKQPLSHERVVKEALVVANASGLEALTMRGLAERLGVEPMSLYHWFPSRDHLLDALLDAFLEGVDAPASGDWKERLSAASHLLRAACQRNPGLVPFVVVHRFNTARALAVLDGWLGLFAELYPEPAARAAAFRTWIHWLVGFCLDEAAGYGKGPSAKEPPSSDEIEARFVHVAALGPYNRPEHFDALFESAERALVEVLGVAKMPTVRSRAGSRARAPGSPGSRGPRRRTGRG